MHISTLPNELLISIAAHLPAAGLCAASRTCRQLQVVMAPILWSNHTKKAVVWAVEQLSDDMTPAQKKKSFDILHRCDDELDSTPPVEYEVFPLSATRDLLRNGRVFIAGERRDRYFSECSRGPEPSRSPALNTVSDVAKLIRLAADVYDYPPDDVDAPGREVDDFLKVPTDVTCLSYIGAAAHYNTLPLLACLRREANDKGMQHLMSGALFTAVVAQSVKVAMHILHYNHLKCISHGVVRIHANGCDYHSDRSTFLVDLAILTGCENMVWLLYQHGGRAGDECWEMEKSHPPSMTALLERLELDRKGRLARDSSRKILPEPYEDYVPRNGYWSDTSCEIID